MLIGLDRRQPSPAVVDYDQMTIEHLAPQSLTGQTGYDEALIGQLGNLLLVSEELNGKLKNKPFKDKKRILLDHGYKLPQIIETAGVWTASQITKRTELMAEDAYNDVWKP